MRRQPEFKQKPLAIAFTVGIHAVVLVGLAFFADAPLPEPPKPLKTVLITPEQLKLLQQDKPLQELTEAPTENISEITEAPEVAETPEEINPVPTPIQPTEQPVEDTRQKQQEQQQREREQQAQKQLEQKQRQEADRQEKQRQEAESKESARKEAQREEAQ